VIRIRWLGLVIQDCPKSAAGRRTLALPPAVVDLLRRRIAGHPRPDADTLVIFPSPLDRLRDPNNTSGDLRAALDRAGFPWVTSHVFHKTVATRLDDAGLPGRSPDRLGHSLPSLTRGRLPRPRQPSSEARELSARVRRPRRRVGLHPRARK